MHPIVQQILNGPWRANVKRHTGRAGDPWQTSQRPGALDPDFQPEDVRLIGDVESLRAISDPTRLRILETMVQRQDPAWSVKELAAEIGVPQTRLYHHVEQLLERDLIRPVERRVVSGIIETRYRVAALVVPAGPRGCSPATPRPAGRSSTRPSSTVFDTARDEIEQAIRDGRHRPRRRRPRRAPVVLLAAASPG